MDSPAGPEPARPNLTCAELARLLTERPLAEMTPEEHAAIAAHTRECKACRERWGSDSISLALHLAATEAHEAAGVHDGVMARLDRDPTPGSPEAPDRISGYDILGKLGRGGMGTVFKARQLSVDRIVALKVMPSLLAEDEGFVARFVREARAAATVTHPNIIGIHDVGQDGGTHYIAMEFVDGETLADAIKREGPMAPERALRLMKEVASAIAAAHDGGVLHRDVKPANILLARDGRVKVADFGLAKRLGIDVTLTEAGNALGTPLYAPPEVARGHAADQRSDLYSFGATFYHVLSGRPPFEGASPAAIALKHIKERPPQLGALVPGLPPALCQIVHRLLEKDPAKRYQTARDVLADLGKVESSTRRSQGGAGDVPHRVPWIPRVFRRGGAGLPLRPRSYLCVSRGAAR